MPEQNTQDVATFNPAAYSLPASLTTNGTSLPVYSVLANSELPSISSYVQTVFYPAADNSSLGASFSDQAQTANSYAEGTQYYSNGNVYSPHAANSPTFAPPIINSQPSQNLPTQPYRFTDQSPVVGDAIYYPPAPTQSTESFAPPANRSTIPYVPKESSQQIQESQKIESVLNVSKHSAPTSDSQNSSSNRTQALIEKTKLIDLRERSQESNELSITNQPARDANTTTDRTSTQPMGPTQLYSETGFLKREAFSSKFSVTRDTTQQKQSSNKIIYLKSGPAQKKPAQLEAPQFRPAVTFAAEPAQTLTEPSPIEQPTPPQLVPDYVMLPPLPIETPPAEIATTVSESTTFVPEAAPVETPKEFVPETVATSTDPLVLKDAVENKKGQSSFTSSASIEEDSSALNSSSSSFQWVTGKKVAAAPKTMETKIEPIEHLLTDTDQTASRTSSGFCEADFAQVEKTEVVIPSPSSFPSHRESAFQVAGYRQAKANTQNDFLKGSQKQSQIILPKFRFNPVTSARDTQPQLTAMTVQNTKQENSHDYQFEMPWLSPWWMLIGLIPLALYFGTTKLFRDDEDYDFYDEGSTESIEFASDFGKLGGSKSDAVYGDEDTLSKIKSTIEQASKISTQTSNAALEITPSRSTVAFAESLIFDLPSTEAIANSDKVQEISSDQSPNFADTVEIATVPTERKKSRKKRSGNKKSGKKSNKRRR